jgi:hypothetical protein
LNVLSKSIDIFGPRRLQNGGMDRQPTLAWLAVQRLSQASPIFKIQVLTSPDPFFSDPFFSMTPFFDPFFPSSLIQWKDWGAENPQWWRSYNNVKHHRQAYYAEANLRNVLHSACGLFVLVFYFYQEAFAAKDIDPNVMKALAWDTSLGGPLRFSPTYRVPDFPDMR